jgi:hypothetical protein
MRSLYENDPIWPSVSTYYRLRQKRIKPVGTMVIHRNVLSKMHG